VFAIAGEGQGGDGLLVEDVRLLVVLRVEKHHHTPATHHINMTCRGIRHFCKVQLFCVV